MTKEEAIHKAELFIKRNGYTIAPIDTSVNKLNLELLDNSDIEQIKKSRHNTLQSNAFCFNYGNNTWTIGFLSTTINSNKLSEVEKNSNLLGRVVIINEKTGEIRIAHKDPLFSKFNKL
jgi:hypothetical protein